MKAYFEQTTRFAIVIWATTTVAILIAAILYTSLRAAGIQESTNSLIALFTLVGLIILGSLLFQTPSSKRSDTKQAQKPDDQHAKESTSVNEQTTWLQEYFNQMSDLILHENLLESEQDSPVRHIAQARTLITLSHLGVVGKANIIRFLSETKLINVKNEIIFLSNTDLRKVDLSRANLSDANLSRADLSDANLSFADLSDAILSRADLSRAYLIADLSDANLSFADLSDAILSRADLSRAYLSDADLSRAHLSGANLSDADLSGANLSFADLSDADLSGADLSGANLSGASVTAEQLEKAKSLQSAIMPDDSKHA